MDGEAIHQLRLERSEAVCEAKFLRGELAETEALNEQLLVLLGLLVDSLKAANKARRERLDIPTP